MQKTIYAILLMVAAVGGATETLTAQPVNLGTCHRLLAAREDSAVEESTILICSGIPGYF